MTAVVMDLYGGSVSPRERAWVAEQIIRQHNEQPVYAEREHQVTKRRVTDLMRDAGRCAQCGDGRDPHCWMLAWALAEQAAARHGATGAPRRPEIAAPPNTGP